MSAMKHRLLTLLIALQACLPALGAGLEVGQPAPDVEAKRLDSAEVFKLSEQRGKVVILNIWASWCGPCKEEMPALQAYYDKYKAKGLVVLAISMDEPRDGAEVRKVAQTYSFPIALKSESQLKGLGRIWRMPSTFVIDRQGILVRNGHTGDPEITLPIMEAQVTPLLDAPLK